MENIKDSVSSSTMAVERLRKRSQEIGDIVALITGITEQTNLLVLKAAIEAARAGRSRFCCSC